MSQNCWGRNHAICATKKIVVAWWRVVIQKKGSKTWLICLMQVELDPQTTCCLRMLSAKGHTTFIPVLWIKPSISLSYIMKYHLLHLFYPTAPGFVACFFQKNTTKIRNFCVDVLYFVGFFPLKRLTFPCCFALRNPVFQTSLALPRKTSKAHANARASKPRAFTSSTTHWPQSFADLVGVFGKGIPSKITSHK